MLYIKNHNIGGMCMFKRALSMILVTLSLLFCVIPAYAAENTTEVEEYYSETVYYTGEQLARVAANAVNPETPKLHWLHRFRRRCMFLKQPMKMAL